MLMQLKGQSHLVDIADLQALINPYEAHVTGRLQWGEEEEDPEPLDKGALCFLSGEALPRCWTDSDWRQSPAWRQNLDPAGPQHQQSPPAVTATDKLRFNDTQVPSIY